jgi:hypothetical protein
VHSNDSDLARLSPAQHAALQHVEDQVQRQEVAARKRVADFLQRAGCSAEAYAAATSCVRLHARVVIHFHPDRLSNKRITVADALLAEGTYRNQFETGLSTGSLSAFPGGARDTWEDVLFGGAYHSEALTGPQRPKYGALELVRYPDGPIPRFGCRSTGVNAATNSSSETWHVSNIADMAEVFGTAPSRADFSAIRLQTSC